MNGRFHPEYLGQQSQGAANFSQWTTGVIYHQELLANLEIMDMHEENAQHKLNETKQKLA
jgi:hypothetical protein